MKFENLIPGNCYSFIKKDTKSKVRTYINIISNNKNKRTLRYNIIYGNNSLEYRTTYDKNEELIKVRPITIDFFERKLSKSKDILNGNLPKNQKTHTVITEKRK